MSCLSDQQRAFVIAMIATNVKPSQAEACAAAAGYKNAHVSGWQLMRNARVLAALKEEAGKRLIGGALVGVNVMIEIAMSAGHKDQYKAAKDLAHLNGFITEQKIKVEHVGVDQREVIEDITKLARELGLDPQRLLGQAGVVIDAEFELVELPDEWST